MKLVKIISKLIHVKLEKLIEMSYIRPNGNNIWLKIKKLSLQETQYWPIMPDPTIADALLDRLVQNAYTIAMSGESMRKKQSKRGNS